MSKTVTSLFHSQDQAADVVTRIEQAGIGRSHIKVFAGRSDDLTDELDDYGIPASDAHAYAEGVRRGGALVAVECDDDEVDRVLALLKGEDTLDLDEQQSSWRQEGWQGHETAGGNAGGLAAAAGLGSGLGGAGSSRSGAGFQATSGAGSQSRSGGERDEVIPIAEEELHVGKRETNQGRVRIHSRVVERPVEEQVTLRSETVEVDRRPVSGRGDAASHGGDPFRERTVEVEERREEAVVSKEARVKEELVVKKGVEQRTETISDTVRKTEVDIEDDRSGRGTGTGTTGLGKDRR